ncbi:MAG: ProQ/FinO family protein [Betaproteobacteria bacterium]|nr:ProQ/FinO family protein [Betaproteobacteria bacterium]
MTSEPMTPPAEENPANTVIPAEPEPDQEKAQDPRELLVELRARFEVFRTFQPLAIGIDKAIRSRLPEANRKTLRIALSMHTHCNRYLRLLAKAEQRFDLDGQPVAEVSEEHRQFATTALEERLQRQANEQARHPHPATKPEQSGKPGKTADRAAGRRNHAKKQANGAQRDNQPERKVSTTSAQNAENPEEKPPPAKSRHKKHVGRKHANAVPSNGVSNDAQAESPAMPGTLAEKLILLTEKFGRK